MPSVISLNVVHPLSLTLSLSLPISKNRKRSGVFARDCKNTRSTLEKQWKQFPIASGNTRKKIGRTRAGVSRDGVDTPWAFAISGSCPTGAKLVCWIWKVVVCAKAWLSFGRRERALAIRLIRECHFTQVSLRQEKADLVHFPWLLSSSGSVRVQKKNLCNFCEGVLVC